MNLIDHQTWTTTYLRITRMGNRKGIFPPPAFQLLLVYWYVSDIINPQIISSVLNIRW